MVNVLDTGLMKMYQKNMLFIKLLKKLKNTTI